MRVNVTVSGADDYTTLDKLKPNDYAVVTGAVGDYVGRVILKTHSGHSVDLTDGAGWGPEARNRCRKLRPGDVITVTVQE